MQRNCTSTIECNAKLNYTVLISKHQQYFLAAANRLLLLLLLFVRKTFMNIQQTQ